MHSSILRNIAATAALAAVAIAPAVNTDTAGEYETIPVHATVDNGEDHYGDVDTFDVADLDYIHKGSGRITADELADLQAQGLGAYVAYDPVSARAGVAHAFDTPEEIERFRPSAAIPGDIGKGDNGKSRDVQANGVMTDASTGESFASTLATHGCPSITYGSRMYDYDNCGGSYLGLFPSDQINKLSDYGWNNRVDSIVVQGYRNNCLARVRGYNWQNTSGSGGYDNWYGSSNSSSTAWNLTGARQNWYSSVKSWCH